MKPQWTHLELAKHWSKKGQKQQTMIIARNGLKLAKKALEATSA